MTFLILFRRHFACIAALPFLYGTAHAADTPVRQSSAEQEAVRAQQQAWFDRIENIRSDDMAVPSENQTADTPVLTNRELAERPELLHILVVQALNSGRAALLSSLNEVYLKHPRADKILAARAEGMAARYRGDYRTAAEIYNRLHREQPDNPRITLDTAAILFEDKQWKEARALFKTALQTPDLPEKVARNVRPYLTAEKEANGWQFGGSISLTENRNANNAAPRYCTPLGCSEAKQERALGLNYFVSAEKNTPLKGHHNLLFRSHFGGTSYYFDKKSQYDSAFGRAYLGWQFQNAQTALSILPFYQWQLAGSSERPERPQREQTFKTDMLGHAVGVQTAWSSHLTPRLQSHLSAELYRQHYRPSEKALRQNGRHGSLFASSAYRLTPQHNVFAGIGAGIFRPERQTVGGQANNQAYTRYSLNGGWSAVWPQAGGLNSRVRVSVARKQYRHQALNSNFQWQPQRNLEIRYSLSLAHPKLSLHGFTPKLIWENERIRSSHRWAERKQQRLFVEIEKQF